MSKKILCIICSFLISLSLFVIPSFASNDFPLINYYPAPSENLQSILNTYEHITPFGSNSSDRNTYVGNPHDDIDIYGFYITTNDPRYPYSFIVASTDRTNYYRFYLNDNLSSYGSFSVENFSNFNSDYSLYYRSPGNQIYYKLNDSFPIFNGVPSGLSALRDFIDNGGSSDSVYDFSTTVEVKPGTVLYIGVPTNGALSMSGTTTFPVNSTWLGLDKYPEAPQRVSRASSLPSAGTQFPLSPNSKPNWQPSSQGSNLLGQNKNAYFSESTWSFEESGFLTFYNPYYFNPFTDGSSDQSSILNGSVYLTISGYSSIRSYPLKESVVSSGNITSDSPDNYESYSDPTIVDNGDGTGSITNWTNQDGSTSSEAPSNNGYNSAPAAQSIEGYLSQIRNTLTKFANDFIELVQAPISHIQQLISAGSGFMSALQGMYAWLPDQIQGYLISALTLIIAIGVFKVFL